jgi:uncharacterized surface protein with fasciclin (FAS1) repeats
VFPGNCFGLKELRSRMCLFRSAFKFQNTKGQLMTEKMDVKMDVIETADKAGNFRLFLKALDAAGLRQTLKDAGPYTILAPVDDAFAKVPKAKLEGLFRDENKESLQTLLRNHIVSGKLLTTELKTADSPRTLKGEELKVIARAEFSCMMR